MKKLKAAGAALVLVMLLLCPGRAVSGAQAAMRSWYASVAPALFPFLALMPVLTGPDACAAYGRMFGKIMGKIFRLPGEAAPAVLVGMVSGSPGGAIALRRIAGQSRMRRADACRIAMAVCGLSPAYLILGVGCGLYGSARLGVRLALVQACVQLVLLRLLKSDALGQVPPAQPGKSAGAISGAVESVLTVCGYMVVFGAASSVAAGFAGKRAGVFLHLAAELPGGLAALAELEFPGKAVLQGAAVGMGGLCIAAQNMDALRGIGLKYSDYMKAKLLSAAGCALGAAAAAPGGPVQATWYGPAAPCAVSVIIAAAAALPVLAQITNTFVLNKRK